MIDTDKQHKKEQLKVVLKKTISRFGVGLERSLEDMMDIYTNHRKSIKSEVLFDLGFIVRDCIDDRGWNFREHLDQIEEFLLEKVHISFSDNTFPEPILFGSKSWYENYKHFQPPQDAEKYFRSQYFNDWPADFIGPKKTTK